MIKVENNVIKIQRGDKGIIEIKKQDSEGNIEQFVRGDKVIFSVKENFSNPEFVLRKVINVEEDCDSVIIELTKDDTTIGNLISKPKTYQYDICVNEDQTILGYDDDGAKELILYPEGSNDE